MRRPPGFTLTLSKSQKLGDYFARLAELEHASTEAFRIVAADLEAQAAPAALVRAVKRAARDEERHAQIALQIAQRHGVAVKNPVVERVAPRALLDVAIENAVEGCVRETYFALVAARQAETAQDPIVRAAMKAVARDESDHAALAWTIAGWLEPRVASEARDRYAKAAKAAVQELRTEAYAPFPETLRRVAGLPAVRDALALIDSLDRSMWQKLAAGGAVGTAPR